MDLNFSGRNNVTSYLTNGIYGIGGKIKKTSQDFKVVEIPAYPTNGTGEYLYLLIEKTDITTDNVIQQLVRELNVPRHQIGYAGIKDRHATTRQYFSVPLSSRSKLESVTLQNASIQQVQQHSNKLRIGHLRGNRFEIMIREPNSSWQENLPKIIDVLQKRGVPNYYGRQRFGNQNTTHLIGRALLRRDYPEVLRYLLAEKHTSDSEQMQVAKQFVRDGDYHSALSAIPNSFTTEKFLLRCLANGMAQDIAIEKIHKKTKAFYVSAYQSYLFNLALTRRLQNIDEIWQGDLAMKHPGQAVFSVEDATQEQERCQRQEISPTGPMFGYKMIRPKDRSLQIEEEILQQEQCDVETFRLFHYKGERRSYRFFTTLTWDYKEDAICLSLTLPKGCYATVVLSEIMKTDMEQPELWEDEDTQEED